VQAQWPLIGRASELDALSAAIVTPGHHGVVIAGASGLGKTRLAHECLRAAEAAGLCTARVTATRAARAIPFGAIAPLLPPEQSGAPEDRAGYLRRAATALTERAGDSRLVLLVDDAHLLDDASATLVHQLAATRAAFVLVTVRGGEPAPDPIVALWKDGLLERLELGGLDEPAVDELVASVLGSPVDPAATAELARHCEGNVLFLRELVLGAVQSGTLRNDGHLWRLISSFSPSDRLVELVESRLADLSAEERSLLEVIAIGEPVGHAELNALGDPMLAEQLERKALIVGSRNGRRLEVRLAHAIYGDVLKARIPPLRVAAVSRVLAEVVESWGARRREDKLRVATWRLDGGGGGAELMLEAATTARWLYDFELAERLVSHALAAGGGFEATFLAAQIAGLRGKVDQADALLDRLEPSTDDERGRVAISRLDNLAFHLGDVERGLRTATEAELALTDVGWQHKITGRRAALILATSGPRDAASAAVPLLDKAEGSALVWACQVAAYSMSRTGELDAAMEASERGHEAHRGLTEPLEWYPLDWHPWVQLFNACEIHANAGRLGEAQALAVEQYQLALAERSVEAQAWFAWQLTKVLGQRGQLVRAANHGREAVALFDHLGRPQFTAFCLAHLAPILAGSTQRDQTAAVVERVRKLRTPGNLMMATDMALAEAWAAVAVGDLPRARTQLLSAAALACGIGDQVAESTALHDLCRIGHHRDGAERLQVLAGQVDGQLVAAKALHGAALVADDPVRLARAAELFAAMGADLLAAEAAWDTSVAWQRLGESHRASSSAQRAAALTDRCDGASTPALQPASARATLTTMERQVALLAASRRPTKAIAAELHISARTVSNHLQRVYTKLGINSREELTASLGIEVDAGPARRP
jgi:DNA-binding CsgD family transcriptional regulator